MPTAPWPRPLSLSRFRDSWLCRLSLLELASPATCTTRDTATCPPLASAPKATLWPTLPTESRGPLPCACQARLPRGTLTPGHPWPAWPPSLSGPLRAAFPQAASDQHCHWDFQVQMQGSPTDQSSLQPLDPLRPDSPSGHKPTCWEFGHLLVTLKRQPASCSVSALGAHPQGREPTQPDSGLSRPFPFRHRDLLEAADPVFWRGKSLGRVWNILTLPETRMPKERSRDRAHERKDSSSGRARCDNWGNKATPLTMVTMPPWNEQGCHEPQDGLNGVPQKDTLSPNPQGLRMGLYMEMGPLEARPLNGVMRYPREEGRRPHSHAGGAPRGQQ